MLGVPSDPLPNDPDWAGKTVFTDKRTATTDASPAALWRVVQGIGGERGWYSNPLLWAIRGWADKLVGGVGLRRGRRHRDRLVVGDAVDFWRVEAIEPGSLLRLRAEMKVPGLAWLEMRVAPDGDGSRYDQRAIFFPLGLAGRLYWLAVLPFHGFIFAGMVNSITAAAVAADAEARGSGRAPSRNGGSAGGRRPSRRRPPTVELSDDAPIDEPHFSVDHSAGHGDMRDQHDRLIVADG